MNEPESESVGPQYLIVVAELPCDLSSDRVYSSVLIRSAYDSYRGNPYLLVERFVLTFVILGCDDLANGLCCCTYEYDNKPEQSEQRTRFRCFLLGGMALSFCESASSTSER